jgi:hypothetical protein
VVGEDLELGAARAIFVVDRNNFLDIFALASHKVGGLGASAVVKSAALAQYSWAVPFGEALTGSKVFGFSHLHIVAFIHAGGFSKVNGCLLCSADGCHVVGAFLDITALVLLRVCWNHCLRVLVFRMASGLRARNAEGNPAFAHAKGIFDASCLGTALVAFGVCCGDDLKSVAHRA